jgi:hypothetical protein
MESVQQRKAVIELMLGDGLKVLTDKNSISRLVWRAFDSRQGLEPGNFTTLSPQSLFSNVYIPVGYSLATKLPMDAAHLRPELASGKL